MVLDGISLSLVRCIVTSFPSPCPCRGGSVAGEPRPCPSGWPASALTSSDGSSVPWWAPRSACRCSSRSPRLHWAGSPGLVASPSGRWSRPAGSPGRTPPRRGRRPPVSRANPTRPAARCRMPLGSVPHVSAPRAHSWGDRQRTRRGRLGGRARWERAQRHTARLVQQRVGHGARVGGALLRRLDEAGLDHGAEVEGDRPGQRRWLVVDLCHGGRDGGARVERL